MPPEKKDTLPSIVLPKKSNLTLIKCLGPNANFQEIQRMEEHATRSMAISKIQIVEKYAAKQPEFF